MDAGNPTAERGRVKRRHVIYVQGYDPRGLVEYYPLFRTEYRKFTALYGLEGTIGRPVDQPGKFTTLWQIATTGADWQVDTTYEFLRWEDVIRRDFARPVWWKIVHAWVAFLRSMIWERGLYFVAQRNWRFAMFGFFPYAIFIFQIAIAVLAALLAARLTALVTPISWLQVAAGAGAAAAMFLALVLRTERYSYMLYLFDDIISHRQYGYLRRPDWEQRFELFASYVVDAAKNSKADEIVVVGHSSGSIVAVDVLTRALARDPALGQHGPRVVLLTVGANLPLIAVHPDAGWFRDRLARLAVEPHVRWIDFQSRKDVMSFFDFDPIADQGVVVDGERHNPIVVPVRFRDIIKPESYPRFRWRFFRVHFQFLMANERRGAAYDYFMICCGPFDLETRALHPQEVVAATESTRLSPSSGA